MIKFIAGFLLAWIIIKQPAMLADMVGMLGTLFSSIVQAFRAAAVG